MLHTSFFSLLLVAVSALGVVGWASPLSAQASTSSVSVGQMAYGATTISREPRHFDDLSYALPLGAITAVAVDPKDDEVLYAGSDGFLFVSDDGGESWRAILSFPRSVSDELDTDRASGDGASISEELLRQSGENGGSLVNDDEGAFFDSGGNQNNDDSFPDGRDSDILQNGTGSDDVGGGVGRGAGDVSGSLGDGTARNKWARQGVGVRRIVIDEKCIYVATPRGLFRSCDDKRNFIQLPFGLGPAGDDVRDVWVDHLSENFSENTAVHRIWVTTRAGTAASTDGGATWRRVGGTLGRTAALSVLGTQCNDEPKMILLGTETGLWKSTDGGENFSQLLMAGTPSIAVGSLGIDCRDRAVYAGTSNGLYVAERMAPVLEQRAIVGKNMVQSIAPHPKIAGQLVIGTNRAGLAFAEDDGNTKQVGYEVLPVDGIFDIARSTQDPEAILVATNRGLFISKKGAGVLIVDDRLRTLRRQWMSEPTAGDLAEAALRRARLWPSPLNDMRARALQAAWLPEIQTSYEIVFGRPQQTTLVLLSLADFPDDFREDDANDLEELFELGLIDFAPARGLIQTMWVQATWQLDEILLPQQEATIVRLHPSLLQEQDRIVDRVLSLYAARQRLRVDLSGPQSVAAPASAQLAQRLRLAEIEALLYQATGMAPSGSSAFILPSETAHDANNNDTEEP